MFTQLNEIAKNYEYLINAIGSLLPFLLALFMAYVAYQQWITNERKRKQELFELRYKNLVQPITEILNQLHSNNFQLVEEGIRNFYKSFSKYRYLISENDAKELCYTFKKMLTEYDTNGVVKDISKYEQNLSYNLQYVDEILHSYLHIENNNLFNGFTLFKSCFYACLNLFIPIKRQEEKIKEKRMIRAKQKIEEIADSYEQINKGVFVNIK